MKAIILAAGYATRLYPLTKNKPKALLHIGEQTILDRLMQKIEPIHEIDDIYIVTNEKFYEDFLRWAQGYDGKAVTVINDRTTTNENRLGAIADIQYVIGQAKITDDIIVLAGDNVFDFELTDFVHFYNQINDDCITAHELHDETELKNTGVIELDSDNRVRSFIEKPEHPQSNLAAPPFYIYKQTTLPLIKQYLNEGNNPDAPGNFIPWLITKKPVYAYPFTGTCYDIGTMESYEKVQNLFGK